MSNWQLYPASDFVNYMTHWDTLNHQLYQSHPMLDSRFVIALLNHFGNPHVFLVVYPENAVQKGNLLLAQPKNSVLWTTFLPSQTQIAPMLCGNPQALQDVFTALPGLPVGIDLLCQDPLYSFPNQALAHADTFAHATTINIDLQGNFEDYWQQRSKNLKQNIKRYFNRLIKNGIHYRFNVLSKYEDLIHGLHRYGEIETKSWKGKVGTAIHSKNEQGQFYGDILKAFASSGQAEIVELYLNDQLAASRINVFNKNMLIILKTTYDETLSNYAPGRLLLYLLIEREFNLKRVQHIEFYTNATPDQISWSSGQRNIKHLTTYRSSKVQWLNKRIRSIKSMLKR